MIGFDLDGVLVPDLAFDKWDEKYNAFRNENLVPIFQPNQDFIIITGRPLCDKFITDEWVYTHFNNNPFFTGCFFGVPIERANNYDYVARFKAKMIDWFRVEKYFESSLSQTNLIKELIKTEAKIFHWETIINEKIYGL